MKTGILRSWKLLEARQKISLASITAFRVMLNLLDIVGIAAVGATAAIAMGSTDFDPALDQFSISKEATLLLVLCGTAIIFIGKTVLSSMLASKMYRQLAEIETEFSDRVAWKIFGGNLDKVRAHSRSEIDFAISQSSSVAVTQLLGQASVLIAEASLAVFIFALFAVTDIITALAVTLYFVAVLLLFQMLTNRRLIRAGHSQSKSAISSTQLVLDLVTAFRELFVVAKINRFLDRLKSERKASAYSNATHNVLAVIPRQIVELALIVGALFFVGLQISLGSLDEAGFELGVYLTGSLRMMSALLPLQRAFASVRYIQPQAEASQTILEYLDATRTRKTYGSDPETSANGSPRTAFSVSTRNLSFDYENLEGPPSAGIQNVSLDISPGEFIALIGPSGSGKSTLVDLLLGIYSPSEGTVLIEGIPPREMVGSRPGSIGYVPQKAGLVTGSLRENVALGIDGSDIDDVKVMKALDAVGLIDLVNELPSGLETDLGKHVDGLSGGQLQRVGVARALYHKPSLLILDEATSSLDAESEKHISGYLANLREETTIIAVAHRLSTVRHADRIVLITDGKVEASGSFDELLASSRLVQRYANLLNVTTSVPRKKS